MLFSILNISSLNENSLGDRFLIPVKELLIHDRTIYIRYTQFILNCNYFTLGVYKIGMWDWLVYTTVLE